ncbi:Uncharacterised protein [Streptococcus pneumoniae]|nr:Uncharacterised protein [Streptococcus pneumoniae]
MLPMISSYSVHAYPSPNPFRYTAGIPPMNVPPYSFSKYTSWRHPLVHLTMSPMNTSLPFLSLSPVDCPNVAGFTGHQEPIVMYCSLASTTSLIINALPLSSIKCPYCHSPLLFSSMDNPLNFGIMLTLLK